MIVTIINTICFVIVIIVILTLLLQFLRIGEK
jgi:hypothetical protein